MAPTRGLVSGFVALLLLNQVCSLPRPAGDSFQDDEDLSASGDDSGGDGGSGSNLKDMNGDQRTGKVYYRVQLQLTGAKYTLALNDRSTQAFKDLTEDLTRAITDLYLTVPGQQTAKVIQYSPGPTTNLFATLELTSTDFYDVPVLRAALDKQVQTGMLGKQQVTPDKFDFLPLGNAGSCPDLVGPEPVSFPQFGFTYARLILNQIYPCAGHVTGFEFYRGSQNGGVFIGVWRLVDNNKYKLLKKVYAKPASIGVQRVMLDSPVSVRDGDFIGFHYDPNAEENLITFTAVDDGDLTENELYRVLNADVFDDALQEGVEVDFAPFKAEEKLQTYALRSIMDYTLAPPRTGCKEDEYQCFDNSCVPLAARCNGLLECTDGSDEFECPTAQCTFQQFTCDDLTCVEGSQRCDGRTDCTDGSDERGCVEECSEREFTCPGTKRCVELTRKCDGVNDCTDGADELDCKACRSDEFKCELDGKCVAEDMICDGRPQCLDASDERGCGPCAEDVYTCPNDGLCLDRARLCDGINDCLGADDEKNCGCAEDELTCPESTRDQNVCVAKERLCDGINDCRDGLDEKNCGCRSDQFTCPDDGYCVDKAQLCDGEDDCRNGADEKNCGCRSDQFTCPDDGYCVDKAQLCDGEDDCRNGADEKNCRPECRAGQFQCPDSGLCLDQNQKCDGRKDCESAFDEAACVPIMVMIDPTVLTVYLGQEIRFTCSSTGTPPPPVRWSKAGGSLPPSAAVKGGLLTIARAELYHAGDYVCSSTGLPDVYQETAMLIVQPTGPPTTPGPPRGNCDEGQTMCRTGQCIARNYLCDGEQDCSDGSDENNCRDEFGCEPNEMRCRNEKCVSKIWRCDGDDDCNDNSDEENCPVAPARAACRSHEWQCASRDQCVPKSYQCDGEVDCQDRSDEMRCRPPFVLTPPPQMEMVEFGGTVTITCKAGGVPAPLIVWRLNWGHVAKPPRVTQTSDDGYGVLTIRNARKEDAGAYTCEAINNKGAIFAEPDTILKVKPPVGLCRAPLFNAEANDRGECLRCFCYGHTTQCTSSNLQRAQISISSKPELVQLNDPVPLSASLVSFNPGRRQFSIRNVNTAVPNNDYYWALPQEFLGDQVESYGGSLSFRLLYDVKGRPSPYNKADIIIEGNGITLYHKLETLPGPGTDHSLTVPIREGVWRRSEFLSSLNTDLVSREDLMMVLAKLQRILIKLRFDRNADQVTVSDLVLDTAVSGETGQRRAVLVEACSCPEGYIGSSCEKCAPGYHRSVNGRNGECVPCKCHSHSDECDPDTGICKNCLHDTEGVHCEYCKPGFYGDARVGTSRDCQACACPLTVKSNQFSSECFLDPNNANQLTCRDCPPEYEGLTCQRCRPGYVGDPMQVGDYCRPLEQKCDPRGSTSNQADSSGQCPCKENVEGKSCARCRSGTFGLSADFQTGCLACLCMGVTTSCSEAVLYRTQIKSDFRFGNDGVTLTNRRKTVLTQTGFDVQTANNKLAFSGFRDLGTDTYYWNLPEKFLGDKVSSYGGQLSYVVVFEPGLRASRNREPDVMLRGAGLVLTHSPASPIQARLPQAVTVPLIETAWRKEDGSGVRRGDLMMVLSQLEAVMIKSTYTQDTARASIQSVSLDSADRTLGGGRARVTSVEQCFCPPGYTGYSCQTCASGYRRVEGGSYLGQCVRCQCHGHADTCDPDTGECQNCRHNTVGASCQQCAPGFYGDATRGTAADCRPESRDCNCDVRGTEEGRVCDPVTNQCPCKAGVTGRRCDSCKAGYFGLSQQLETGCAQCWCSGLTDQCQSAQYYREQIGFTFDGSGRTELALVTSRDYSDPVVFNGYAYDRSINGVRFNNFAGVGVNDPLFWTLPNTFLANKMLSYGGVLQYTAEYQAELGASPLDGGDVQLVADRGATRLYYKRSPAVEDTLPSNTVTVKLRLVESSFRDGRGRPVERATLMRVLSDLDALLIRASVASRMSFVTLGEVSLDTAVARDSGRGLAPAIETCQCPQGYDGLSCQRCASGYQRDAGGRCVRSTSRCDCNGHSQTCDQNGRCQSCQHNTRGERCEQCQDGYYGDATRGTASDCRECPCPLTIPSNRFSSTCRLDTDGLPTCTSCARGYTGRNCERCAAGYYGNPLEPGDTCRYGAAPQRPVVTVRPADQTADEGGTARLTCEVVGSEPLIVRWLRGDGAALPVDAQVQNRVLTFPRARQEHQGEYVCTARNNVGEGRDSANLRVVVAQGIDVYIEEPRYLNINEGGTARFVCKTRTQGGARLVWSRRDGASLARSAFQRDGLLTIPNAGPQDRGFYVCTGTNSFGQRDTDQAELNVGAVVEPPEVTVTPRFQTVTAGERVEIRCQATGRPEPTLEFVRVSGLLNPRATFRDGVFVIPAASQADEAEYACKARNAGGDASMLSVLYVRGGGGSPPVVEIVPTASQTVSSGGSATIECRASQGTPPVSLAWSRPGGRRLPSSAFQQSPGVLRLTRVTATEAGDYICTGTNQFGSSTATASVNLRSAGLPPVIRVEPASPVRVLEGSEVRITCSASGLPQPTVYWTRVALAATPERRFESRSQEATVVIARAQLSDSGSYVCSASNAAGTATETLQLEVIRDTVTDFGSEFGSIEIEGPEERRVREGTNVELVCRASGIEGGFDISWKRGDGRALSSNAYSDDYTLYIDNIRLSEAGEYYCVARSRSTDVELQRPVTVLVVGEARPPSLLVLPKGPIVVREGTDLQITCRSDSQPVPEITWQKQGDTRRIGPYRGQAVQRVERARLEDSGTYVCVGRNAGGTAQETVEVTVQPRQRDLIIEGLTDGRALLSSNIVLMCKVRPGIGGRWYYEWSLEGGDMEDNAYYDDATLYVDGVRRDNAGTYRCVARSLDGGRVLEELYPLQVVSQTSMPDSPPSIALRPERVDRVEVGQPVVVTCQVLGGFPKPDITWTRASGRGMGAQTFALASGELRISTYRPEDEDDYICTARNRAGGISRQVRISTDTGPSGGSSTGGVGPGGAGSTGGLIPRGDELRIVGPARGVVPVGEDCVLICSLHDRVSGEFSYEWRREGGLLPTSTRQDRAALFIEKARTGDGGRYVCRAVSRSDARAFQAFYDVKVLQPTEIRSVSPQIEIYPRTLRGVALGSRLTLYCLAVSGYPPPVITWTRRSGRALSASTRVESGKLTFDRLSPDDEDTYTCTASNRLGQHSGDATVTLSGPGPVLPAGAPVITIQPPSPIRLRQGEPLRLVCSATGADPPLVYWTKEGSSERPAATRGQAELAFDKFSPSVDGGVYTCHASNKFGQTVEQIRLDVSSSHGGGDGGGGVGPDRPGPQREAYIQGPLDGLVPMGSNLILRCKVRGSGRYYYDWRMDSAGQAFGGNVRYDDATLYIDQVSAADSGRYRCVAQAADDGSTLEAVFDIKPTERRDMRGSRPVISISPDTLTNVAVGSNFVLQCRAISGFPEPTISWTRASGRGFTATTRQYPDGRLAFTRLAVTDEDRYICTAQNQHGAVTGTVNLRLEKGSDGRFRDRGSFSRVRRMHALSPGRYVSRSRASRAQSRSGPAQSRSGPAQSGPDPAQSRSGSAQSGAWTRPARRSKYLHRYVRV